MLATAVTTGAATTNGDESTAEAVGVVDVAIGEEDGLFEI